MQAFFGATFSRFLPGQGEQCGSCSDTQEAAEVVCCFTPDNSDHHSHVAYVQGRNWALPAASSACAHRSVPIAVGLEDDDDEM